MTAPRELFIVHVPWLQVPVNAKSPVLHSTNFVFVERHIRNKLADGYKLMHCEEHTS